MQELGQKVANRMKRQQQEQQQQLQLVEVHSEPQQPQREPQRLQRRENHETVVRVKADDKLETSSRHASLHLERVLKKHKLRTIDLEIALNDMDDSLITPHIGKQLQSFLPTDDQVEEVARLKKQKKLKREEEPFWRLTLV